MYRNCIQINCVGSVSWFERADFCGADDQGKKVTPFDVENVVLQKYHLNNLFFLLKEMQFT